MTSLLHMDGIKGFYVVNINSDQNIVIGQKIEKEDNIIVLSKDQFKSLIAMIKNFLNKKEDMFGKFSPVDGTEGTIWYNFSYNERFDYPILQLSIAKLINGKTESHVVTFNNTDQLKRLMYCINNVINF